MNKKLKKAMLFGLCSSLSIGAIIGITSSIKHINNSNDLGINSSLKLETNQKVNENIFSETTLTKAGVTSIGWDQKTTITLADWTKQAPNVTQIGENDSAPGGGVFAGNTTLTSIEIPDKVTVISPNTFDGANALIGQNISIPLALRDENNKFGLTPLQWSNINWRPAKFNGDTLTKANVTALGWDNKKSITLQDWTNYAPNVTKIGADNDGNNSPFLNNLTLISIEIPDTITFIGNNAFTGTANLTGANVSMPIHLKGDSTNRRYGFDQNQWNTIAWRITPIQGDTLNKTTVTSLGWDTAVSISLDDWRRLAPNVTKIGTTDAAQSPFQNNTILKSIVIPKEITIIDVSAFKGATALTTIIFEDGATISSIGANAFEGAGLTAINIPDSVKTIADNAFNSTNTTLSGDKVSMAISLRINAETPSYGFVKEQWDVIDWRVLPFQEQVLTKEAVLNLNWDKKITITLDDWKRLAPNVTQIGTTEAATSPFANNKILQSIQIPNTVSTIGHSAFKGASLATISFVDTTLTTIGIDAFAQSGLTAINIPNSVSTIDNTSFAGTDKTLQGNKISMPIKLKKESTEPLYGFTIEQWNSIVWKIAKFDGDVLTKEAVALLDWNTKTTITLADWSEFAPNVTQIGANNETISSGPFANNAILTSIEIPSKVKLIGDFAFASTASLTKITIEGTTLTSIGANAFDNAGIISINIPSSVTTIGDKAFNSTKDLKTIQLPYVTAWFTTQNSTIPQFGFSFEQWQAINWNNIPTKGVKINSIIAKELLKNGTVITWEQISIYDGIESEAFKDTNITSITIRDKDNFAIGTNAFAGTEATLKEIEISEKFRDSLPTLGLSENQQKNIQWIAPPSSDNLGIILGSVSAGIAVIAIGIGVTLFIKNKKNKQNTAK